MKLLTIISALALLHMSFAFSEVSAEEYTLGEHQDDEWLPNNGDLDFSNDSQGTVVDKEILNAVAKPIIEQDQAVVDTDWESMAQPEEEEEMQINEWISYNVESLNTDESLREMMNLGTQYVIRQATKLRLLSKDSIYHIDSVHSIEVKVGDMVYYKFSVDVEDDQTNLLVMSFTVSEDPYGQTRKIERDYTLTVETGIEEDEEQIDGGVYRIHAYEVNTDPELQDVMNFGIDYVLTQAIYDFQLQDSNYQVAKVNSIKGQVVEGYDYTFNLELQNKKGGHALVKFTVYDYPEENVREVTSYLLLEVSNKGQQEKPTKEWVPVDVTLLNTDENLRDMLNLGVQYIIQQEITKGFFSLESHYHIEKVTTIESQTKTAGAYYKFNVEIEDDQSNDFLISFIVYDQPSSNTREVRQKYTLGIDGEGEEGLDGGVYRIDANQVNTDLVLQDIMNFGVKYVVTRAIEDGQLQDAKYQVQAVNSIKGQVVEGYDYTFNVELRNYQGGYATVTFDVYDYSYESIREVTSYLFFEIEEKGPESDPEEEEEVEEDQHVDRGWIALDVALVNSTRYFRNYLNLGVNHVVTQGIASGRLLGQNYTVKVVNSLEERYVEEIHYRFDESIADLKEQILGNYYYKFDINLADNQGQEVKVSFVIHEDEGASTSKVVFYEFLESQITISHQAVNHLIFDVDPSA